MKSIIELIIYTGLKFAVVGGGEHYHCCMKFYLDVNEGLNFNKIKEKYICVSIHILPTSTHYFR